MLACCVFHTQRPSPFTGRLPDHGHAWADRSCCHSTLPPALNPRHLLRELVIPSPTALGLVDKEGSREHSCVPLNQGSCLGNYGHQLAEVADPDQQAETGRQSPRGQGGVYPQVVTRMFAVLPAPVLVVNRQVREPRTEKGLATRSPGLPCPRPSRDESPGAR